MRARRLPRRPTAPTAAEDERLVRIARLGADGDGLAALAEGDAPLHVEGALPGETVWARGPVGRRWAAVSVADPSAERVAPPCPLAGPCGGCTLQHWKTDAALAWKTGRVEGALRDAGHDGFLIRPAYQVPPRTRRRMVLSLSRLSDGSARVGLRRRESHEVVDMTTCHVLDPALFALVAPFRRLLASTRLLRPGESGTLIANLLDNGPDLLFRAPAAPEADARAALARFAATEGVARVSWHAAERDVPEPIAVLRRPTIVFGGRDVEPAPGAFLQAVPAAEAVMVGDVLAALDIARKPKGGVVELYAGSGTLTFPLAAIGRVDAFEGDALAFEALRRASGGTRVLATRRDLVHAPVTASELRGAGAVVLDPPYGGAGRQIEEVASALVPTVVVVSCNPAALAREALSLRRASYRLESTRAIDQFLFSARVESVSVFRRP